MPWFGARPDDRAHLVGARSIATRAPAYQHSKSDAAADPTLAQFWGQMVGAGWLRMGMQCVPVAFTRNAQWWP